MMKLPVLRGRIARRVLINFRVEAEAARRMVPAPFVPRLQRGFAVAGVCLIRLESIRPAGAPAWLGTSSENAAHRIAVCWDDGAGGTCEGVFIPRRDSASWLNRLAGGRLFPGVHGHAGIDVRDDGVAIDYRLKTRDGVSVSLRGRATRDLPAGSCFASLAEASAFFASGALGYSATPGSGRLDGVRLQTEGFALTPLAVERVHASRFAGAAFAFDSAFVMRDLAHEWHAAPALSARASASAPDRS